jgi:hypothetical protein
LTRSPLADRRRTVFLLLFSLVVASTALTGCPFKFENERRDNAPPSTFFLGTPRDTTFENTMAFGWNGTDEDSDVVAYQFQLVATDDEYYRTAGASGQVLESIEPRNFTGAEQWSDRTTDDFRLFTELLDGPHEMRVRAIDAQGEADRDPARHRFVVFFDDVSPEPDIVLPDGEGIRLMGDTQVTFSFTASDQSRNGTTPRHFLEYQYQLRGNSLTVCSTHQADPFFCETETPGCWSSFPVGNDPVVVDYNDLGSVGCTWTFTLRVRDPAGNQGVVTFAVEQVGA